MVGEAMVVDASVMPPIAGLRSALVAPAGYFGSHATTTSLTARMAVRPGDQAVRLNLRFMATSSNAYLAPATIPLVLAVPGGARTVAQVATPTSLSAQVESGAAAGEWISDVVPVELRLPDGASSEVVLEVILPFDQAMALRCAGFPRQGLIGLQVDDLHVE